MNFSIIIPVYNVAEYVSECLDSILGQTVDKWECVCVDDGSTDDSGKILDAYARDDSRIRVIHQSNKGVASARNAALDVITGDWFLFLDADDVWSPYLLDVCRAGIEFEPAATIIQFGDRHFSEVGGLLWEVPPSEPTFSRVDLTRPFSRRWLGFTAPRKAFRRILFSDIRQRPYCVGEDLLYMTECALRAHMMIGTEIKLYGYRDRPTSVTRNAVSKQKVIDHVRSNLDIVDVLCKSRREIDWRTRKELCNVLTEDIATEYVQLPLGERPEVRQWWMRALRVLKASGMPYGLQRKRIQLMTCFPYVWVWRLLAQWPRQLKSLGLHR